MGESPSAEPLVQRLIEWRDAVAALVMRTVYGSLRRAQARISALVFCRSFGIGGNRGPAGQRVVRFTACGVGLVMTGSLPDPNQKAGASDTLLSPSSKGRPKGLFNVGNGGGVDNGGKRQRSSRASLS